MRHHRLVVFLAVFALLTVVADDDDDTAGTGGGDVSSAEPTVVEYGEPVVGYRKPKHWIWDFWLPYYIHGRHRYDDIDDSYADRRFVPDYLFGIKERNIDVSDVDGSNWVATLDHRIARPFVRRFASREKYQAWEARWQEYRTARLLNETRRVRRERARRKEMKLMKKALGRKFITLRFLLW